MSKAPQFAEMSGQFLALRHLVEKYPDLPSGYVVCHGITSANVTLLLDSLSDFEMWREALGVSSSGVDLITHNRQFSIEMLLPVGNVVVRIWAVAEVLVAEGAS